MLFTTRIVYVTKWKLVTSTKICWKIYSIQQDHSLHSTTNKKVLGKMKDETREIPIQEFIGLRAKQVL
jgi:hypothetical protein